MSYALGVDLGTTYTAAAVRLNGHAEVARLGSRRAEIPSLVFVRPDGGVLIGEAAERRGAVEPFRLAREFKRRIGDPVPLLVGGSPYPAHALMARLLEDVLGTVTRQQEGPPDAVTVTYPANWGPYKRDLLDQAVRLADLRDVTLRSEPEAAAVRYAATEKVAVGETVAVYDLGGGTFDAAVLRKTADGFSLLGEPEGIEQLGGIDFDEAVLAFVTSTLGPSVASLDPDDPSVVEALARLRRDCVEAKEALSYDTEVMVPVALPNLHTRVRLNRSEFETMITPAVLETIAALRRALRSAGDPEVRSILLSGGSSRIPLVSQLLSVEFDRPVVLDPSPEHSIALGAALVTSSPAPAPVDPSPDPVVEEEAATPTPSRRGRVATMLSKLGGRSRPSAGSADGAGPPGAATEEPATAGTAPDAGTAISGAAIAWDGPPAGNDQLPVEELEPAAGASSPVSAPPAVAAPPGAAGASAGSEVPVKPSLAESGDDLAPDTPSRGVARVRSQPPTGRATVSPLPQASGRATVPHRTDHAGPVAPTGPAPVTPPASGRAAVGRPTSSPPREAGRITPTGRAQVGPVSGPPVPDAPPPVSGPPVTEPAALPTGGTVPAPSGRQAVSRRPFSTEPPAPPPAPPLIRPTATAAPAEPPARPPAPVPAPAEPAQAPTSARRPTPPGPPAEPAQAPASTTPPGPADPAQAPTSTRPTAPPAQVAAPAAQVAAPAAQVAGPVVAPQALSGMYGAPPTADLRLGTSGHGQGGPEHGTAGRADRPASASRGSAPAYGTTAVPPPVAYKTTIAPPPAAYVANPPPPAAYGAANTPPAVSHPATAAPPAGTWAAPPAVQNAGISAAPPAAHNAGTSAAPPATHNAATSAAHNVGTSAAPHAARNAGAFAAPPAQDGGRDRAHPVSVEPSHPGRQTTARTYRIVKIIVILVVVAGLVAAAGGAYWFFVDERKESGPRGAAIAQWTRKADLPLPLEGAAVAAYQGKLWVAGGQQASDPSTKSNEVFVYDPASDDWSVGPALPNRISHATLVPTPAGLYLVGGWLVDGGSVQVLRLDGAGRAWVPQTPLPESRVNGVGGFTGTEIVYAGGTRPGPSPAGTVWALRQDTWVEIGALATPRQKAMAAGNGTDTLWVLGGRNIQTEEKFGTIDLVTSGAVNRSDRTLDPPIDSGAGVYVPDSGICVVGGQTPNGGFNDWWCWEGGLADKLPALNPRRGGLAAAIIDRTVYVVGGYGRGFSSLSRLDTLTLPKR